MDVAWFDVGDRNTGVMTLPVVKVGSQSDEDNNYWRYEECKLSQLVLCRIIEMVVCQAIVVLGNMCQ